MRRAPAALAVALALAAGCAATHQAPLAAAPASAAAAAPAASAAPAKTAPAGSAASSAPASVGGSPSSQANQASPSRFGVPAFSHVFIIVLENLAYAQAAALPYVSSLEAAYGTATDYFAVSHPSLPNYLALTSGQPWVSSDCTSCFVSAPDLASQAAAAGVSWGAYMEGLPSACWLGAEFLPGLYAAKHDPFRYYDDVRGSRSLCAGIRPLGDLESALAGPGGGAPVPRLVWVTPNLCDDGHSCAPARADAWLRGFVPRILGSAAWRQGGVLFITWDESSGADASGCCGLPPGRGGGHVLTLVIAPGIRPGLRVAEPFDHYSLLATVEDGLDLGLLGQAADPGVQPLAAFWGGAPA